MRTTLGILKVSALVCLFGTFIYVRAGEEKVPLDKLPKAVAKAVKKRFPKAKMVAAGKETENGKTVYEVGIKEKGQSIDVTVTPKGAITEIEKAIKAEGLPKAVSKALATKYPKASYEKIEEIIKVNEGKERLEYYEVLLETAAKKKHEVQVSPAGKIIKEEDKSEKKK